MRIETVTVETVRVGTVRVETVRVEDRASSAYSSRKGGEGNPGWVKAFLYHPKLNGESSVLSELPH